ncbi:MAG TPA: choice-of-anchor Q domain-containing protein, partial [Candidatus Cybelea sp.]|nr:choice-of-anchor Q domain-containing protein [Candidatus Cybelea sp.]
PTTHYVDAGNTAPVIPYTNWSAAATNIQDAVNVSIQGDFVLVTNGIYQYGGIPATGSALTNRVAATLPITLQSVNGPAVTTILGYQLPGTNFGDAAVRCVYLTNGAALSGFTLANGATRATGDNITEESGGAVWCATLNALVLNCVLTGCAASYSGGGAYQGALIGCTISSNSAAQQGGGAWSAALTNCAMYGNTSAYEGGGTSASTLSHCTLTANAATYGGGGLYGGSADDCLLIANQAGTTKPTQTPGYGGGANGGALVNCTIISNVASDGGGTYYSYVTNSIFAYNSANNWDSYDGEYISYCCTTPSPGGTGNIGSDPVLIDPVHGNFRLQSNSPCINAGNNSFVTSTTDLDGRPRVVGGTVDMGAYEYQGPGMGEFTAWLQQYGLPTDGSADYADSDHNGMSNLGKWRAGLNPTNPVSVLQMITATNAPTGLSVTWQSVSGINYYLQRAGNLQSQPAFSSIQSNIVGQTNSTTFTDTNVTGLGPFFYRVGVQ